MNEFEEFQNDNETNTPQPQQTANNWEPTPEPEAVAVTPEFVGTTPENDLGNVGMAVASLVLGIVSFISGCCFCIPFISVVALPVMPLCAVTGLILGIISLGKKQSGKGMAIAGVILSGFALLWGIILGFLFGAALVSGNLGDVLDEFMYEMF